MSLIDKIISNIVPHDCLGCGYEGRIICVHCAQTFGQVPPRCYRCQKVSAVAGTCSTCQPDSHLQAVYAATSYGDLATELVWRLKFHSARAAAGEMARSMAPCLPPDVDAWLMPVPTASSRARRRGYDQAKLLARELSRRSGLPYVDGLRRRGQTHQVGASRPERLRQLTGAFYVKRGIPADQSIILVDDVLTTGATLEAAAAALKRVGVHDIRAIVFARA